MKYTFKHRITADYTATFELSVNEMFEWVKKQFSGLFEWRVYLIRFRDEIFVTDNIDLIRELFVPHAHKSCNVFFKEDVVLFYEYTNWPQAYAVAGKMKKEIRKTHDAILERALHGEPERAANGTPNNAKDAK